VPAVDESQERAGLSIAPSVVPPRDSPTGTPTRGGKAWWGGRGIGSSQASGLVMDRASCRARIHRPTTGLHAREPAWLAGPGTDPFIRREGTRSAAWIARDAPVSRCPADGSTSGRRLAKPANAGEN
jgi:hypothetical protein